MPTYLATGRKVNTYYSGVAHKTEYHFVALNKDGPTGGIANALCGERVLVLMQEAYTPTCLACMAGAAILDEDADR